MFAYPFIFYLTLSNLVFALLYKLPPHLKALEAVRREKLCRDTNKDLSDHGRYNAVYRHSKFLGTCKSEDFEITHTLGRGYFGEVKKAKHHPTGRVVAIKFLKGYATKDSRWRRVREEECAQHNANFRLIAQHYCTALFGDDVGFILEFIKGRDLSQIISKPDNSVINLRDLNARFIIAQLVVSLEYLHSQGVLFNDLKTKNILVDKNNNIKLIDFGLAKYFGDNRGSKFARQISKDWYYLGGVLFYILAGYKMPKADSWKSAIPPASHSNNDHLLEAIGSDSDRDIIVGDTDKAAAPYAREKISCPSSISHDACDLIRKLCKKDWRDRWGLNSHTRRQLREHPWFEGRINWNDLSNKIFHKEPELDEDQ